MSKPTQGSMRRLHRIGQYLHSHQRMVWRFDWQDPVDVIDAYGDASWAACQRTRKSTSGGVVMVGHHLIGHGGRTQATIALSSGEAELNASVKGASEGLGLQQLSQEIRFPLALHLLGDSSAAKGILLRTGAGAIKHLCIKQQWVQERATNREIVPFKNKAGYTCGRLLHPPLGASGEPASFPVGWARLAGAWMHAV